MCVFLFGQQCHRNSEWAASNLELLIGLALPHVTEQVPAGLSDASCRSQHRLPGLHEDDITTFITPARPALRQAQELSKTDFWIKKHHHWDSSAPLVALWLPGLQRRIKLSQYKNQRASHLGGCRLNRSEQI